METYELKHLIGNTYYLSGNFKCGFYLANKKNVYLIDSGINSKIGKIIYENILKPNNWNLKAILNTHSHLDHLGGNYYLFNKTHCQIYSTLVELSFHFNPQLEYDFVANGLAPADLNYYYSKKEKIDFKLLFKNMHLIENGLPAGIIAKELLGHFFKMQAFKTLDEVWFIADGLLSKEAVTQKYKLFFIYDVSAQLETLEKLKKLNGKFFVPYHSEVLNFEELIDLIKINQERILKNIIIIKELIGKKCTPDKLKKRIFDYFKIPMDTNQYYLVGVSIHAYLTYLLNQNKIKKVFKNNIMYWKNNDDC